MIKPKAIKSEIDEEDPWEDDNEDYENDEDRPGFESEPDLIEEEVGEDLKDKSKAQINKERLNTRKRELFSTTLVYLKNGMEENYEME